MEKDDELKGSGNSYDFGARIYDPRLGRWLGVDPLTKDYPGYSGYCHTLNNPIAFLDPDGKRVYPANQQSANAITSHVQNKFGNTLGNLFVQQMNLLTDPSYFLPSDMWSKSQWKEYNKLNKQIKKQIRKINDKELKESAKEYHKAFSDIENINVVDVVQEVLIISAPNTNKNAQIVGEFEVKISGLGKEKMNFKMEQFADINFDSNNDGAIQTNEQHRVPFVSQATKNFETYNVTATIIRAPTSDNGTNTYLNDAVIQDNIGKAIQGKSDFAERVRQQ